MANSVYAVNHAQEIFKTALEQQELNRWQSDLRRIAGLARDATLLALLDNPEVSSDEKVSTKGKPKTIFRLLDLKQI